MLFPPGSEPSGSCRALSSGMVGGPATISGDPQSKDSPPPYGTLALLRLSMGGWTTCSMAGHPDHPTPLGANV